MEPNAGISERKTSATGPFNVSLMKRTASPCPISHGWREKVFLLAVSSRGMPSHSDIVIWLPWNHPKNQTANVDKLLSKMTKLNVLGTGKTKDRENTPKPKRFLCRQYPIKSLPRSRRPDGLRRMAVHAGGDGAAIEEREPHTNARPA